MTTRNFFQKGLNALLRQQTNILSAALIIMATVIFSQLLGLIRQRLLVAIYGASDILGNYLASAQLPYFLFQLIIAGALSSAFIPVFSQYLEKKQEREGHIFASKLLLLGLIVFFILGLPLWIFAEFFTHLVAPGFPPAQIALMANLMRIMVIGQIFFIIGSFFSAVLQSYNHFFVPAVALALYNFGIILGIILLSPFIGIYSAACGVVIGSLLFVGMQLPMMRQVGFVFHMNLGIDRHIKAVFHLMWPRTISIAIFQIGSLATLTLISYLSGRNYVIFDYAQTLAFAPVILFGQTIAQAAFPVLSREKDRLNDFKTTFITSFNQMLYLVLPISVLFLVLRIPIVRLIYGASQFDWPATVLTGRTLAFFSISIFAQALIYLVYRGFYALHDTITPLIVGAITTICMLGVAALSILVYHNGVETVAFAYSLGSLLNFFILFVILDRKTKGFHKLPLATSVIKIFAASACTAFALYIPIKLLDQLVFDTTKTINLLALTGISSLAGLSLYLFLTWLLDVKEALAFVLLFKKIGNWREILKKSEESIDGTRVNP